MPFPGLNIDNLPFFAVIAAVADGRRCSTTGCTRTVAIYLVELNKSVHRSSCWTRTE